MLKYQTANNYLSFESNYSLLAQNLSFVQAKSKTPLGLLHPVIKMFLFKLFMDHPRKFGILIMTVTTNGFRKIMKPSIQKIVFLKYFIEHTDFLAMVRLS